MKWQPPTAQRTIKVGTANELKRAIHRALPGDHILLAKGEYGSLSLVDVHGTQDAPIMIAAIQPGHVLFSGSINGRNAKLSNASHIILTGLRFTQAEVWGVTIGPAYPEDTKVLGCREITLYECEVDHAGQSLVKINGNSESVDLIACRLHHSGNLESSGRPYSEGVYVGEGASLADRSHAIRVLGCHIYAIGNERNWGEAVDIKGQAYDILIEGNLIESVVLDSGGAITALIDKVDYPEDSRNPNIVIRENVIRGVVKRPGGWHGAGICVGANGIEVEANEVSGTEGPALLAIASAGNTQGVLVIRENHFMGTTSINKKWRGFTPSPITIEKGIPLSATGHE